RPFEPERGSRPGYRPGASGGWRRRSGGGYGSGAPFRAGEVADRGPLERGTPAPEPRARDMREFERQREWRDQAARAISSLHVEDDDDIELDQLEQEAEFDEELTGDRRPTPLPASGDTSLPTLHVLGFGVSHKRLEQAVRELGLPVQLVREADEADVVITLRNYFKQKAPALREAEERGLPIFVLKSNTMVQMESALTSVFALEVDPRDAALREVEEAIGLVSAQAKPVELSPQNAYIRRLQHQMAERANLVSHSRGREPYRRVRLYPDNGAPRIRR
ncbi:MAG: R3H domain-containing nucleic acid-binding protein, partial [Chloroflexota bacterium]